VLTGGEEDEVAAWLESARGGSGIPVFTLLPGPSGEALGRSVGAEETFASDPDPGEVALLGHRTIQRRRLQAITGIVGESDPIREALERVVQIAPADSTVLITGESGTGKELIARGIHALSQRRHRGFLAINVAALSETLLESELFGHEKGAFTGAIDSRKGFFELANRGTLFLDEIGEMPLSTQTKLLRVLEQREFLRVGGEKPIRVDVRIIAATNQELRSLIATGRFRRDLYFRLNILSIELPPLRRRREDIPRLIHHFVREFSRQMDRPFPGITDAAMRILSRYDWPGNVRELRNLVESMVVLSPGREIGPADIPREVRAPSGSSGLLPGPTSYPSSGQDTGFGGEVRGDSNARSRDGRGDSSGRLRPELEFVFRTLVELRVDMDQLRRDFDLYRDEIGERTLSGRAALSLPTPSTGGGIEIGTLGRNVSEHSEETQSEGRSTDTEGSPLSLNTGMTMDEIEREAVRAALAEVGGNRRKAAERLGIGERTLYRKIRKYGLDPK
jgi:DNA-binding NtrC family response regulator